MKLRVVAVLALGCSLAACMTESRRAETAPAPPPALESAAAPAASGTLYQQLGGQAAVEKLVDVLIAEIHGDKRINHLFKNTDIPYFRARLIEQLCEATGGPCKYTGLSMEEAHSGLKITNKEFDQFVEDLNRAMGKAGLSKAHQGQLLGILGPMRPQVIDK